MIGVAAEVALAVWVWSLEKTKPEALPDALPAYISCTSAGFAATALGVAFCGAASLRDGLERLEHGEVLLEAAIEALLSVERQVFDALPSAVKVLAVAKA